MQLTHEELAAITYRAQSLWERLDGAFAIQSCDNPQGLSAASIATWKELIADGDEEIFRKRLAYDAIDLDAINEMLTTKTVLSSASLPRWASTLEEILARTVAFRWPDSFINLEDHYGFLRNDAPIPFEEIFLPCILVARDRLVAICGDKYHLLTDIAHAAFERFLLQRLSSLSSRILEVEFSTFIACLQIEGLSYVEVRADTQSRIQYLRFIQKLYIGDLALLFQEYCVWARRLAVQIDQWVDFTAQFLERLNVDMHDIQNLFLGRVLGRVESAEPGLSDPHAQGRTVIAVTFEAGLHLVYKPKDMCLEQDYFRLADWLNNHGAPLSFRILKILNRGFYGWVEYAEHSVLKNQAEAHRYFMRTGLLLCLMYVFDGIDFHSENLIACGEYPVPIDLETLFHHRIRYTDEIRELTSASRTLLSNSVLRSHFLPNFYRMSGNFLDVSGIGGAREADSPIKELTWQFVNTDAMVFKYETVLPTQARNSPRIGETYLAATNYTSDVVDGFGQMYRLVMGIKETLLAEGGLIEELLQNRARFVFRGTHAYTSLLARAVHPDYQHDGIDLSLQLDVLSRALLRPGTKPVLWPLIREEQEFLFEMDVPKFMAKGTSDSLPLNDGTLIPHCFSMPASERVKEKISDLDEKDLMRQIGLIKSVLELRSVSKSQLARRGKPEVRDDRKLPSISRDDLICSALSVADELVTKADFSADGEPSWITLRITPNEQFVLDATDFSLYDGCSGIAVFFSELEADVPDSGFRTMAYATVALMRRWLKRSSASEIARVGIGGYTGLGSIAYALVQMGELLDDDELFVEGLNAARLIHERMIDADRKYDVLSGSAGAILSLLACHKRSGDKAILGRAEHCGRHLLNSRVITESGFRVWNTIDDTPLLGFAHGASGIAYSLIQLYQASDKEEFLTAAMEAIAYETALFMEEENDWPDLRGSKQERLIHGHRFMCGWCNGAAGIALARIGGLDSVDSPGIRKDIQMALQIVQRTKLQSRDHLCCGNLGLSESLLTAGLKLEESYWIEEALKVTSQVAHRAKRKGAFQPALFENTFTPGLFQGTAGVGYHLLRLSNPQPRSSLLLLE